MKIDKAEVIVTSPGRNYVTLRITSDTGVTGLGDATLNGRELSVVSYLRDHVCPQLIGKDASRITDLWEYLYKGAYWRRGPVTMTAIAAVDCALWDILGKATERPVHELLGGAVRDGVLVYGHASGRTLDDLLRDVGHYLGAGYRAVRVQAAIPGLDSTYGIHHDGTGHTYEPADGRYPTENVWDTAAYLRFAPEMMAAVRETYGYDFHLLHDVHHRLTPREAAKLGKSLEPFDLFWIEDATPAEDQRAFELVRSHTVTPLAVGEIFNSIWDCHELISRRLVDYIRCSVSHAGGITHLRRIFDLAALYGVRTGSHGAGDLSPVSLASALQLDIAVPNFGIQEYMGHLSPAEEVFMTHYRFEDGYLKPGDRPGLGVEIDEDAAARYPYEPRSLPINRLRDGTMHDW
ncbi:D-mannonate dehydratase ManD [Sciscionella marina]|uniref:D-mannonate dehydratase ManD n=1 Tax=Sciscionella marina TaxID=508770 RepID=UPI00037171D7|nr:D-mannonate dehydratase ManD [Sciscionella marina]